MHHSSMKRLLFLFIPVLVLLIAFWLIHRKRQVKTPPSIISTISNKKDNQAWLRLKTYIAEGQAYAKSKAFSADYQFLIDMSLPSGKKRFFVYSALTDSVVYAGLVAHGSCRTGFLPAPQFSNVPECGCSSLGKYKVDDSYQGQFGKAYKLRGLDSTNSNAFDRTIVLHAYDCVPDEEVEPYPICNSLGCPMVSYKFLETISEIIDQSSKPILLSVFN